MGTAIQLNKRCWFKSGIEDLILSLGYYLLCLQVVSYKVLLQFLVGIVNTELL